MSSEFAVSCEAECVFAGDLFLSLAARGLLVLDPERADRFIAEMTAALDVVRTQSAVNALIRSGSVEMLADDCEEVEQLLVDAVFVEQMTQGRLDEAMVELPKYIRAFEMAKAVAPAAR